MRTVRAQTSRSTLRAMNSAIALRSAHRARVGADQLFRVLLDRDGRPLGGDAFLLGAAGREQEPLVLVVVLLDLQHPDLAGRRRQALQQVLEPPARVVRLARETEFDAQGHEGGSIPHPALAGASFAMVTILYRRT